MNHMSVNYHKNPKTEEIQISCQLEDQLVSRNIKVEIQSSKGRITHINQNSNAVNMVIN